MAAAAAGDGYDESGPLNLVFPQINDEFININEIINLQFQVYLLPTEVFHYNLQNKHFFCATIIGCHYDSIFRIIQFVYFTLRFVRLVQKNYE